MRTRTAQWFECKIKYDKLMENNLFKQVTELYVVDAMSYAEAEGRIVEEMKNYIGEGFTVEDIKKASYREVIFDEGDLSDRFYRAKLQYISTDEKSGTEKRSNVTFLVHACSFDAACKNLHSVVDGTMTFEPEITAVGETKIMDVFEYENNK